MPDLERDDHGEYCLVLKHTDTKEAIMDAIEESSASFEQKEELYEFVEEYYPAIKAEMEIQEIKRMAGVPLQ